MGITNYSKSLLKGLIPRRSKLGKAWSERYGDLATAELYRQVQIKKYGYLARLAGQLLKCPEEERDHRAKVFWRAMRSNVGRIDEYGDEILGAAWTKAQSPRLNVDQDKKLSAVQKASSSYSKVLRQHPLHGSILNENFQTPS